MIESAEGVISKRIGRRLKSFRLDKKMTQLAVAGRLGISDRTVSAWETGRTALTIPDLWTLADVFHVDAPSLARHLGLCGDPDGREIKIAECADILSELDGEPPEVVEGVIHMFRTSVSLVKSRRLARDN